MVTKAISICWTADPRSGRITEPLDDAAAVLPDVRIDKLAAVRFEAFERPFLIRYVMANTLAFTIG